MDLNTILKQVGFYPAIGTVLLVLAATAVVSGGITVFLLSRRTLSPAQRYQFFQRYQNLSYIPLFFVMMILLSRSGWEEAFLGIFSYFFAEKIFIVFFFYALSQASVVYLFIIMHSVLPGYLLLSRIPPRQVKLTRQIRLASPFFFLVFLMQLVIALLLFYLDKTDLLGWIEQALIAAIFGICLFLVMNYFPYFISLIYGTDREKSRKLKADLAGFMAARSFRVKNIIVVRTCDIKMSNAWAGGLGRKYVFFTDYLLNYLSIEQIKSVLAHEIGHIRLKHLWINFMIVWMLFCGFYLTELNLPHWRYSSYILLFLIVFVFIKLLLQRFEQAADRFAVDNLDDPVVYLSTLESLSSLNSSPFKISWFEEKVRTHPSLERRKNLIQSYLDRKAAAS